MIGELQLQHYTIRLLKAEMSKQEQVSCVHADEAATLCSWYNSVFMEAQHLLGIPQGSIKVFSWTTLSECAEHTDVVAVW